jgi:hypothetical protein
MDRIRKDPWGGDELYKKRKDKYEQNRFRKYIASHAQVQGSRNLMNVQNVNPGCPSNASTLVKPMNLPIMSSSLPTMVRDKFQNLTDQSVRLEATPKGDSKNADPLFLTRYKSKNKHKYMDGIYTRSEEPKMSHSSGTKFEFGGIETFNKTKSINMNGKNINVLQSEK